MLIAGNVETNDEDQTLVDKREDEEDKVCYYFNIYFVFLFLFSSSLLISLLFLYCRSFAEMRCPHYK